MAPDQEVEEIGHDLGVGAHGALVAEHLEVAPVDPVGGDLAVVDDGPVEEGEGVGPGPPARRVGGEAAVGDPDVGLVFLEPEEVGDVFGIAHGLEGAHVLPAGEDVGAGDVGVDPHDALEHEVLGGDPRLVELRRAGQQEVAHEQGRIGDVPVGPGGDALIEIDVEVLVDELLRGPLGGGRVEHDVERELILALGIDAIGGEAASEPVGSLVEDGDGLPDRAAVHPLAREAHHAAQAAAGYAAPAPVEARVIHHRSPPVRRRPGRPG